MKFFFILLSALVQNFLWDRPSVPVLPTPSHKRPFFGQKDRKLHLCKQTENAPPPPKKAHRPNIKHSTQKTGLRGGLAWALWKRRECTATPPPSVNRLITHRLEAVPTASRSLSDTASQCEMVVHCVKETRASW